VPNVSDPVAFGTARLDEDEAEATAAPGEHWQAFTEDSIAGASVYDEQWVLLYPVRYDHDSKLSAKPDATGPQYIERARDDLAAHIARHDPARVLREVEAHRVLLGMHRPIRPYSESGFTYPAAGKFCGYCGPGDSWQAEQEPESWSFALWPCRPVRVLLAIWSDHPDYDQEWKP
jgi:hypothetical protein